MKIINYDNGTIVITDDWEVASLAEGVDLSTVDVSNYRLKAHVLADVYDHAKSLKTKEAAAKYVKLRNLYLEKYRK